MKKYIYFTLLFLTTIACQAQSPVFDIMDVPEGPKGSYYKDKNGLLDGYDGTYVYPRCRTNPFGWFGKLKQIII